MAGQSDSAHPSRAKPRFKVFQPTEMTTSGTTTRVHLLNLSTCGALIHAAEAPAPGTSLRLRCGDEVLVARVAWTQERKFGVSFARPLADGQIESVVAGRQH